MAKRTAKRPTTESRESLRQLSRSFSDALDGGDNQKIESIMRTLFRELKRELSSYARCARKKAGDRMRQKNRLRMEFLDWLQLNGGPVCAYKISCEEGARRFLAQKGRKLPEMLPFRSTKQLDCEKLIARLGAVAWRWKQKQLAAAPRMQDAPT